MELCFYNLLSKIKGCLLPTLTGAVTLDSNNKT